MIAREDYSDVGTIDADDLPAPLRARRAVDVMATPGPVEILEDLLYADCLTVLVSESGAGKTFLALDALGAIASGVPWHGRDTTPGTVVYLAYEGSLSVRLRALERRAQRDVSRLYVLEPRETLSPRQTRDGEIRSTGELRVCEALAALSDDLAAAGEPPIVAIVIDTVRASLAGSEDSSEHVSAYLRAVRRIMTTVPGAAMLLIHHAGWQDGEDRRRRERGSSAWRGNCDVTVYLEAGEYDRETGTCPLTLTTLKARDGEVPAPLRLVRRRVELLDVLDRHGEPVTSCVIERDTRTPADRESERQAAIDHAQAATDLQILRVVATTRITSQDVLRELVGGRKSAAGAALARLQVRGWIARPQERQPYIVTPDGQEALARE